MKYSDNTTSFFERVYDLVRLIPAGKVTTYGAIARYLGASRSARIVGWAMNASHGDMSIPAHRVVNRNGLLTGKHHFEGTQLMEQLLESEGVRIEDHQVVDMKSHFWDPNLALESEG